MKKRILIVEDEAIIAKSLKSCLENFGYYVFKTVSLGEDAIESAGKNKPDLILMDVRLRGLMTGYEAVTAIRRHCNTPVLYSTGGDQSEIDEKAKDTKPYDYVIKPFDPDVLAEKIKKLLGEKSDSLNAVPWSKESE